MRNILVIGAGKSCSYLTDYLQKKSTAEKLHITIADISLENAQSSARNHANSTALQFDVFNEVQRRDEIEKADIVVSMLPARFHVEVAKDCLHFKKHMVTASYISPEMKALNDEAVKKGLVFMNEIGVDPGIDHMSAMEVIDRISNLGAKIILFESFTGGLVAPESDNNLWNYKFTWNPRNVVLAGQGTAQYLLDENYKYIPYNKLFKRTEIVNILNEGEFEAYANRDSLSYRESYGLENISTMFRGTLRKRGFCKAWDIFVQLGMTSDEYKITNSEPMNCSDFTKLFLPTNDNLSLAENLCNYLSISKNSDEFKKIEWLGIFSNDILGLDSATPAQFLQLITEKKLSLEDNDKDMIVMQHQFKFSINNKFKRLNSSLIVYGDNQRNTAMAKTVGLPVAISVKLILNGSIKSVGVKIPTSKDIYIPILKELEENGVNFIEEYSDLK